MAETSKKYLAPLFSWRSAVASECGPSPTTRLILLTLGLHMNEKGGSCFPSIQLLIDETGLSKKTVISHINKAVAGGWLEKRVLGRTGQGWKRHEYLAVIPHQKGGVIVTPPFDQGGVIDGKKVVSQLHPSTSKSTSQTMQPKKPAAASLKKVKHNWFTKWWCFAFQQITAEKYVFTGKDAKLIQLLLKQIVLAELVERACYFLLLPEVKKIYPIPKGAPTIGGLSQSINILAGKFDDQVDAFCTEGKILPSDSNDLINFKPWENAA